MCAKEWSDWRGVWYLWLQSVYVVKEKRKRGIFTKLYRYVEEKASQQKQIHSLRLYVDKENKSAQKTYEKLGMSPNNYNFFEKTF